MSVIIDRKTVIGPEQPTLTLVFDASFYPPYTTVEEWNTFFDLPNRGIPFTSLEITNYTHILKGGSNITLYNDIFNYNVNFQGFALASIVDNGGCIIGAENSCFDQNAYLTTINLPSLQTAGDYCFGNITALTTINLPSLQTAGDYCFSANTTLITINLPSLQTAGESCFFACTSLATVNLPSLLAIDNECFRQCTSLITISLPSLLTAGGMIFNLCSALSTINLPSLQTAGESCFFININGGSLTTINVPSLQTAGDSCFQALYNITILDLPSLQTVGAGCFSPGNINNTTLTTLNLPSLVAPNGLGGSPDDNVVFSYFTGVTIRYITNLQNLTIPSAFQTNNAGNEDGDISTLRGSNPSLTINWV
jgi:hypothetical protein